MLRFLLISILQSFLLAGGQVFLKLAMDGMGRFEWTWVFFRSALMNWYFAVCGVSFVSATVLWLYIIKNFPFSLAYPLTSIAYIFGMLASLYVFHETIPPMRWIGVGLIIVGMFFMLKQ